MTSNSGSEDRFREFTRAPLQATVTLQVDAFSEPESGYTGDLSVGGMFVKARAPQPVGSILRFELDLGPPSGIIRGTAEVAWIRAHGRTLDRPAGMGLQFRFIEGDGQELLRTVVARAIEEQGLPPVPEAGPEVKARRAVRRPTPPRSPARPRRKSPPPARAKRAAKRRPSPGKQPQPTLFGLPRESAKLIVAVALLAVLLILLLRMVG